MDDKTQTNYISGNKPIKSSLSSGKFKDELKSTMAEAQNALKTNDDFAIDCAILYRIGQLRAQIPEIRAKKEACAALRWEKVRTMFEHKFTEIENTVEQYSMELFMSVDPERAAERVTSIKKLFFDFEDYSYFLEAFYRLEEPAKKLEEAMAKLQGNISLVQDLVAQYPGAIKGGDRILADAEKAYVDAYSQLHEYDDALNVEYTIKDGAMGSKQEITNGMIRLRHNAGIRAINVVNAAIRQNSMLEKALKDVRSAVEAKRNEQIKMTERYLKRVELTEYKYNEVYGTVTVLGGKAAFALANLRPENCAVVTLQTLDGIYAAKRNALKISFNYLMESGIIADDAKAVLLVDAGSPVKLPAQCFADTTDIYFSHNAYERIFGVK